MKQAIKLKALQMMRLKHEAKATETAAKKESQKAETELARVAKMPEGPVTIHRG